MTGCPGENSSIGLRNSIDSSAQIGPEVVIGDDNIIMNGVVITGKVVIGNNNRIYPHAVIGQDTRQRFQPKHRREEPTDSAGVRIGSDVLLFESVTVHRAMVTMTEIADSVSIGAHSHIAHDVIIDEEAILSVGVMLGGYAAVGSRANVGIGVSVHPRTAVGGLAMVGMGSTVLHHVPPAATVYGVPARLSGINTRGLSRAGVTVPDSALRAAWRGSSSAPEQLVAHFARFDELRSRFGSERRIMETEVYGAE